MGLYKLGFGVDIVSKLLEGDYIGFYIEILGLRVLGLGCWVVGVGV